MNNIDFLRNSLVDTKREGVEDLISYMGKIGFLTAPCSSRFHLAKEGGLLEHTVNVMKIAEKIGVSLLGGAGYNKIQDSVIIAAALHDLGKCGQFGKPNYVPDGDKFKSNLDLLYIPHEVRSVAIAQMFIDLTEEEQFAILYHNGLYARLGEGVKGIETPLYMILHWADMWASRVVEVDDEK